MRLLRCAALSLALTLIPLSASAQAMTPTLWLLGLDHKDEGSNRRGPAGGICEEEQRGGVEQRRVFEYDARGWLKAWSRAGGGSAWAERYERDQAGRIMKAITEQGAQEHRMESVFERDPRTGHILQIKRSDARGWREHISFLDRRGGWSRSSTTWLNGERLHTQRLDVEGTRDEPTAASGVFGQWSFAYDARGRRTSYQVSSKVEGGEALRYTARYDKRGLLLAETIANEARTHQWSYDERGRVTAITLTDRQLSAQVTLSLSEAGGAQQLRCEEPGEEAEAGAPRREALWSMTRRGAGCAMIYDDWAVLGTRCLDAKLERLKK